MNPKSLSRLLSVAAILSLPAFASAQEAAISGTVSDTTGGVLPGVVIRAVHVATGNNLEAVTDEGGTFRIPVRVGVYEITAELSGFSTVTRRGLEVLVGQQVSIMPVPASVRKAGATHERFRRTLSGTRAAGSQ